MNNLTSTRNIRRLVAILILLNAIGLTTSSAGAAEEQYSAKEKLQKLLDSSGVATPQGVRATPSPAARRNTPGRTNPPALQPARTNSPAVQPAPVPVAPSSPATPAVSQPQAARAQDGSPEQTQSSFPLGAVLVAVCLLAIR